jgi:iron(III) transport system ATP-binding protein
MHFTAEVVSSIFVGSHMEYELTLPNGDTVKASVPFQSGMKIFDEGDEVSLIFDVSNSVFLPA